MNTINLNIIKKGNIIYMNIDNLHELNGLELDSEISILTDELKKHLDGLGITDSTDSIIEYYVDYWYGNIAYISLLESISEELVDSSLTDAISINKFAYSEDV